MMIWLDIINFAAVGLFGIFLSAAFCDISWTKRNKMIFAAGICVMAALQALNFTDFGAAGLRAWYPVITHLPLVLLLAYLSRKPVWSTIAVLTAYLCCQLRRWLGLLCIGILGGGTAMQAVVEIIVTVPLLLLVIRTSAAAVRSISHNPLSMQLQFGLMPAIGYIFDYMTRVYTDWLVIGLPAATEFMLFVCAVAVLVFAVGIEKGLRRQTEMEQQQLVLDLQIKQAAQQIESMEQVQEQAAAYRHDLRHHLQYLSACAENQAFEQMREYIRSLNQELEQQTMTRYCENVSMNLILTAYADRAAKAGIPFSVKMRLGAVSHVSDMDMCVLLSNALENALYGAMAAGAAHGSAEIKVHGYEKNERIFLEIVNSCVEGILFEDDIPVTGEAGHGVGVRSICAIVKKYEGIYVFEAKDGRFILRLSI